MALVLASVGCFFIYGSVFALLQAPLHAPLYFTSPQGGFNITMSICLVAGLIAAIPLLVYHILMFLGPAFPLVIKRTRCALLSLVSFVLACTGAAFALFVVIPLVLRFFTGFQTAGLSALITASSYFDLVAKLLASFALIFQLPLILWGINRIKPLSPRRLFGFEKYVIAGSVGVGVLVPFAFDLTTQALIALPIVVLYNLSILVVVIDSSSSRRKQRKAHQPFPAEDPRATRARSIVPLPPDLAVPTQSAQTTVKRDQTRRPPVLQDSRRPIRADARPAIRLSPREPHRQASRAPEAGRSTPPRGGLISDFVN
ncbi:hypothetical protein GCM10012320_08210 [Sinomonas cellulolyticus]|nr:hypothetical protein GCM10012320_08210 [Sinomonas sp. KCTC 49339]